MIILPLIVFFQTWNLLQAWRKGQVERAFLEATLLWGANLVFLGEGLGLFSLLTSDAVALSWAFEICALELVRVRRRARWSLGAAIVSELKGKAAQLSDSVCLVCCAGIAIVLCGTLAMALLAPIMNWDSLTYHLPRVQHWIQNRNLSHYPTNITRQLFMPPWPSLAVLNLQLLDAGSDRFVNLIQWAAFAGALSVVAQIIQELGGDHRSQWFGRCFVATIPVVLMESSTTQTDVICAYWVCALAYFALHLRRGVYAAESVYFGLALGLGLCTKGTFYFLGLFFGLIGIRGIFKALPLRSALLFVGLMAALVLGINGLHWKRNWEAWGSIQGPRWAYDAMLVRNPSPVSIALNGLKNFTLQVYIPNDSIRRWVVQSVARLHEQLGVVLHEPKLIRPYQGFDLPRYPLNENYAPNPLHLAASFVAFWMALRRRGRREGELRVFTLSLVGGLILLWGCIRWLPGNSRYAAPALVLMGVPVSLYLRPMLVRNAVPGIVLVFSAFAPLFFNSGYALGLDERRIFGEAVEKISASSECVDIGLYLNENSPEYWLWSEIKERNLHFRIHGSSPMERVCAIIAHKPHRPIGHSDPLMTSLNPIWTRNGVSLYL
ncbi:MAG: hypothetical protein HYR96_06335 [Deltaproteobacteria bacterium]|nr:hypothetical protein [Deltaproteobacteria bacterium]